MSISPPDPSAQAGHCARFYPMARNELLEMYSWGFATKRVALALTTDTVSSWQYVYEAPADSVSPQVVLSAGAGDDWSTPIMMPNTLTYATTGMMGVYAPQPYRMGQGSTGATVIYTNTPDAVLIYTAIVSDPSRFSPLFISTLSYFLAAKLAGPIIKGQEGRAVAAQMLKLGQDVYSRAVESDANQQRTDIKQSVSWQVNR